MACGWEDGLDRKNGRQPCLPFFYISSTITGLRRFEPQL